MKALLIRLAIILFTKWFKKKYGIIFTNDDAGKCAVFKHQSGMRFKPAGRGNTEKEMMIDLYKNAALWQKGKL